jgi:hypothetical protein
LLPKIVKESNAKVGKNKISFFLLFIAAYFFFPPFSLWERALPAAVLLVALVLPSLKTFEAAVAADLLVTLLAISL